MQIYGAYTRGIDGHLFTVSATSNPAGRIRVTGISETVAQHTATIVTHALKRLGAEQAGADVHLEPATAADPPLATGQYSRTLELPIALAALTVNGKLPHGRLDKTVAVGGLDPYRIERDSEIRCIGATGTTAIAETARTRTLNLIVAEDQAPAAFAECMHTMPARTLEELVAVLSAEREPEPVPPRAAGDVGRRAPGTWRISEDNLRALEIACAGWHNIHVAGPPERSVPEYGVIAQALLPALGGDAARETTKIHGVAGLMAPWVARMTEPPLRIPHFTASRGAITGSRGGMAEVHLAHNGVLVIDQPTEFDRYGLDALVATVEDGQTVICRHTPVQHTIRVPARFRLMVTTHPEELGTRRHRAAALLDLCDIEITAHGRTENLISTERLQAGRERIRRAAAILAATPPRRLGAARDFAVTPRRVRAVAQTVAAFRERRQIRSEDRAEAERLLYRGARG